MVAVPDTAAMAAITVVSMEATPLEYPICLPKLTKCSVKITSIHLFVFNVPFALMCANPHCISPRAPPIKLIKSSALYLGKYVLASFIQTNSISWFTIWQKFPGGVHDRWHSDEAGP